jgi:hypothetical protein
MDLSELPPKIRASSSERNYEKPETPSTPDPAVK